MTSLFAAIFFVTMQGIFAGLETGMVSVLKPRVEHAVENGGSKSDRIMYFFISNPGIMISTSLVGVNISVVCGALATKSFLAFCGITGTTGIILGACVISIMMLSCEIIPKNWFRQSPYKRCSKFVWILYLTYFILYVPVRFFAALSTKLDSLTGKRETKQEDKVLRDDMRLFLRESESGGVVDAETAAILERVMMLPSKKIGDLMIKSSDVVDMASSTSVAEAVKIAGKCGIDKIPVYLYDGGDANGGKNWCGIFNVYDAIYSMDELVWNSTPVTACMDHLHFLHEDDLITDAVEISRGHNVSLFVVLSKTGEQIGILSPDDVASTLFE